ncbi:unnamed protein product [Protopolystoma xenopodis]|uniref:Uncharacterized protein n=1 Tax=Protopolystoma xenopodis TaxID=117903 RepID=A0A3S5FDL5_9PLAT|nr:unnamed protein product [Protopolystoma xenopodis]
MSAFEPAFSCVVAIACFRDRMMDSPRGSVVHRGRTRMCQTHRPTGKLLAGWYAPWSDSICAGWLAHSYGVWMGNGDVVKGRNLVDHREALLTSRAGHDRKRFGRKPFISLQDSPDLPPLWASKMPTLAASYDGQLCDEAALQTGRLG